MRGFISPQPPSQPAAVIPSPLALSAAQSQCHSTPNTSTSAGTSARISTDINTGIATGERSKQSPNLDACRPPRRYSPQYELASYFSAIQVDDELDSDKDDYIVPKIPDFLATRRQRLANSAALVYRDVRQRRNDNVQIAIRRTAADHEDGDDMAVDDCMDLAEGEIQPNFRPAERGCADRVWKKKKQMRVRKRDKEGGGKRERDKKAKIVTAAAKQAGGNSGLSVPVPAPLVSDGQHDPTHGYVHQSPSYPFQRPP